MMAGFGYAAILGAGNNNIKLGKKTHKNFIFKCLFGVFKLFFFLCTKSFSESVYLFLTRNHNNIYVVIYTVEPKMLATQCHQSHVIVGSWRMRGNVFIQIIRLTSSSSLNRNIFQMECNSETISIL